MEIQKDIQKIFTPFLLFCSAVFMAEGGENSTIAEGNQLFSIDLYKKANRSQGNVVLSPFIISYAFALSFAGAKGETAAEISDVFHFTKDEHHFDSGFSCLINRFGDIAKKGDVALSVAVALWPDERYRLLPEFINRTKTFLKTDIQGVDFSRPSLSCRKINEWVSSKTRGKFGSIVEPSDIDEYTRIILTAAAYFKGKWEIPFPGHLTENREFYLNGSGSIKVPTMFKTDGFHYGATEDLQVLELAYKGGDISMVIFLPKAIENLSYPNDALCSDSIAGWIKLLGYRPEVEVYLPKFKFSSEIDLQPTLQEMGIAAAFDRHQADFSGISGMSRRFDSMCIKSVFEKADIEVNEMGTEASAVTAIHKSGIFGIISDKPKPVVFRADHPFMFIIQDKKTEAILFIGRVTNPVKTKI